MLLWFMLLCFGLEDVLQATEESNIFSVHTGKRFLYIFLFSVVSFPSSLFVILTTDDYSRY